MYLNNVKYVISAPSKKYWLPDNRKEICFVGRSNVGKSTLINKITNNKNTAKVSNTPGLTKYLNFFDVDNKYYLVDTPGYGFAKASYTRDKEFENMMSEYIYERNNLICVFVLIDCKVGFTSDDILILDILKNANRNIQIIVTKTDKTNQSERHKFKLQAKEVLTDSQFNNIIYYSSLKKDSYQNIIDKIFEILQ